VTPDSALSLHVRFDSHNQVRLRPSLGPPEEVDRADELCALELRFVESERAEVQATARQAPDTPEAFVAWFESLERTGEGQGDPLFDWLERDADLPSMTWFLRQEVAGEAGFDDLLSLTQVKMPERVKLELARNYWDEMGQGNAGGMHGPMLGRLAEALGIHAGPPGSIAWESLALGNLMIALAANRQYAYQSIGALGVIELTAPGRATKVNAGLQRLGVGGEARRYFALHATLDVKHSQSYDREVLYPLVAADPRLARPIAEGALMRLHAGARCFERYRRELGLSAGERRSHPRSEMVSRQER
jgi:hypothetical protein